MDISASSALSSTSSISTCSNASMSLLLRQSEIERGAGVRLAVGPHPPAVANHDPLDERQPDAGSVEFAGVVEALEHPEQLGLIARVETRAVVTNEIDVLLFVADRADFDQRLVPFRRELERIRQEVGPYLSNQYAVAPGPRQGAKMELGFRAVMVAVQPLVGGARELSHVELDHLHRLASHPREREQIVDEQAHALRLGLDHGDLPARLFIELVLMVLLEHPGEAGNGPQRRAQIVG